MKQEMVFYADFYLKTIDKVRVLDIFSEKDVNYVHVDRVLFYPQGGGEKGDKGIISFEDNEFKIVNTVKDKKSGEVLLKMQQPFPTDALNKFVTCFLDWDFRYEQMKLHTLLHLHHCFMERSLNDSLKPPKVSDIQQDFAFNRYDNSLVTAELMESANTELKDIISKGAIVNTVPDNKRENFRWWKCLDWTIPCGGCHVSNVSEIGNTNISFSKKSRLSTIKFELI